MAFPLPTNCRAGAYRQGHAPPAAPDSGIVGANLNCMGAVRNIKTTGGPVPYTHWLDVPLATDVRDAAGGNQDTVYLFDGNGNALTATSWLVQWVERIRVGGGSDYKRVYLKRKAVTWPSNQL